jgi:hypothetical protein
MGRDILFSMLLGGAMLTGVLAVTACTKGWKAFLMPFLGISAMLLIWSLASVYLPR